MTVMGREEKEQRHDGKRMGHRPLVLPGLVAGASAVCEYHASAYEMRCTTVCCGRERTLAGSKAPSVLGMSSVNGYGGVLGMCLQRKRRVPECAEKVGDSQKHMVSLVLS